MSKLIIIKGYSATGKSTIAKIIGQKHKFVLVNYDYYMFHVIPYHAGRELKHQMMYDFMNSIIKYAIKYNQNIIIEGHMVKLHNKSKFIMNLGKVISNAKKNKYKIYEITFIADEKVCYKRMKKRKSEVAKEMYYKIVDAVDKGLRDNDFVVDTSKLTEKKVVKEVEKLCELGK